jgi:hypothetical protein
MRDELRLQEEEITPSMNGRRVDGGLSVEEARRAWPRYPEGEYDTLRATYSAGHIPKVGETQASRWRITVDEMRGLKIEALR